MVNNGYDLSLGAGRAAGRSDLVAFGKTYIANPDLVQRLRQGGPFNEPDRSTFYGGGEKGYTDYPRAGVGLPAGRQHRLAQPAVGGGMVVALVPQRIDMHDGHGHGQLPHHQRVGHARHVQEVAWQHRQQVRAGHNPAPGEKLVDDEHHPALQPERGQRLIDKAVGRPEKLTSRWRAAQ